MSKISSMTERSSDLLDPRLEQKQGEAREARERHTDKRKKKRWQTQLVKTNDNTAGRATQGSNQYWAVLTFRENRRFRFFERVEKTALVLF